MSQEKHQGEWKPNLVEDNIAVVHWAIFIIHAVAWPFRLLWTVPGSLGRRQYKLDCLAGLMFAYPACGQWITDRTDGRIFMRLWQALWCLLVVQLVMSWLLNRRNRVHSRSIGMKTWGGHFLMPCLIAALSYFFLRPAMNGLGTFLSVSPTAYALSNFIVELRMRWPIGDVWDAEISGGDFQRRIGGRDAR